MCRRQVPLLSLQGRPADLLVLMQEQVPMAWRVRVAWGGQVFPV